VAGDGEEIDAELGHVGRNLADGLGRVGVKQDAALARDARALCDRFDGADLVVGVHDGDEDRARRDGAAQIGGIDAAGAVDRQVGHLRAQAFEEAARLDDGRMLDRGGDDVVALVVQREEHALQRQIVGLAAAAGENDLVVLAPKQRRHLAARIFERGFGLGRGPVSA
jgi:hypothetical protein